MARQYNGIDVPTIIFNGAQYRAEMHRVRIGEYVRHNELVPQYKQRWVIYKNGGLCGDPTGYSKAEVRHILNSLQLAREFLQPNTRETQKYVRKALARIKGNAKAGFRRSAENSTD